MKKPPQGRLSTGWLFCDWVPVLDRQFGQPFSWSLNHLAMTLLMRETMAVARFRESSGEQTSRPSMQGFKFLGGLFVRPNLLFHSRVADQRVDKVDALLRSFSALRRGFPRSVM